MESIYFKNAGVAAIGFLGLATNALPSAAQNTNGPKRNIIFILIDDQRYDLLSFLHNPLIKTPNIDRLCERGMYFSNAFVTTSLSSPSRASILTGLYAHQHRVIDNDTPLSTDLPTFPAILQKNGYKTAFIGKWHMGGSDDNPRPGFDFWLSFKAQGVYNDPVFNINGKQVSLKGYTTNLLTDYACDYIKEKAGKKETYCLYLSHKAIHEPSTPAKQNEHVYDYLQIPRPASFDDTEANYKGKPEWLKNQRMSWHGAQREALRAPGAFDEFYRTYSECMLSVDESVGRITSTLKELGQLENTIFIYYSDNGFLMGEHGLIDKRVMYDESIRVPAFVFCPELIPVPKVNNELILNIDIAPSILELAGAEIPSTMQGKSFVPLLKGENVKWRDSFIYEYFIDPNAVMTPTIFGLRTKTYSYMTYPELWDAWELYDLQKDPEQMNNLIGNVKYGQAYGTFLQHVQKQVPEVWPVVKSLDEELNQLLKYTNGTRTPRWKVSF